MVLSDNLVTLTSKSFSNTPAGLSSVGKTSNEAGGSVQTIVIFNGWEPSVYCCKENSSSLLIVYSLILFAFV